MNDDIALLQLMLTPGLGSKTLARLMLWVGDEEGSPEEIVRAAPAGLAQRYGLSPSVAAAIGGARAAAEQLAQRLERHEIRVLALGTSAYPAHLQRLLGKDAPPLLYARGNLALLQAPGVAFGGSRKASEKGLSITIAAATTLALSGVNVVSGYANGVDLAAHSAALTAGGTTTFVLAEGILQFRPKREVSEFLDASRYLVISEFPPDLRWIARNAMQRNRTIIGLAQAMLIIESGLDGGTFAAGEETLKLRRPLFVIEYGSPPPSAAGNAVLIQRGARPVHADASGQPNLTDLLQVLDADDLPLSDSWPARVAQPTLIDALPMDTPEDVPTLDARRRQW